MSKISIIAAVDNNFGLGKNNQLLCHLPADLRYFKAVTLGKPVIMGRKTFQSIGKPLPQRQNIIISKHFRAQEGIEVVNTLEDAIDLASTATEVMIIGGASIYKASLPFVSTLYLTHIDHQFEADVFFPEVDWHEWSEVHRETRVADASNCYNMTFAKYIRTR